MTTFTSEQAAAIAASRARVSALHNELVRYGLVVWTAGNVSERVAAEVIEQLVAARFIAPAGDPAVGHRFAPEPGLAAMVEMIAAYYRSHLVEVTSLIHSRTGRMAQHFADAFKLRKDS